MRSRFFLPLFLLVLVWAGTALAGPPSADKLPAAELQRFQGKWQLVSGEKDGAELPADHVQKSWIRFSGKKVEISTPHQSKEKITATIVQLDLAKDPRQIFWVRKTGPNKGKTMSAIYQFQAPDRLMICFDPVGQALPAHFDTNAGSGHIWHVWERVKSK